MGRYNAIAVKGRVTTSFESGTIDPNCDGNADPENYDLGNADADKFAPADVDSVHSVTTKVEEVLFKTEVEDRKADIDNEIDEIGEQENVIEALNSVSLEMFNLIEQNGRFTPAEALVMTSTVSMLTKDVQLDRPMPSMEDFKVSALGYSNATVSLESIGGAIKKSMMMFSASIKQSVDNIVGYAKSFTPRIQDQIVRAQEVGASLGNADRNAGEKELSGGFVSALTVDGAAPDARKLLSTGHYLSQCINEILGPGASQAAGEHGKQLLNALSAGYTDGKIKSPSVVLRMFLVYMALGAGAIVGGAMAAGSAASTMMAATTPEAMTAAGSAIAGKVMTGAEVGGAANASLAGIIHINGMDKKVNKQVKINGEVAPALFELFPSSSKVRGGFKVPEPLEARHSLPLFGNHEIQVSQYDPLVMPTVAAKVVPTLQLVKAKGSTGKTMQTLSTAEQKEALKIATELLNFANTYYKDYKTRNAVVYSTTEKAADLIVKTGDNFSNFSERAVIGAITRTLMWYNRIYFRGVFKAQGDIAQYAFRTGRALIDLVVASNKAAGGTVSHESFDSFA